MGWDRISTRTSGFGTGYRVGAETSNAARYFLGGIAEVIVYDHALTPEELAILEDYLSEKYGIAIPATATPTPTEPPTNTPTPSETLTPSDTPPPTDTPTPEPPTETFTPEPTLTPTEEPTATETESGGFIDPGNKVASISNNGVIPVVLSLPGPSINLDLLPNLQGDLEEVTRTIEYNYDGLYRLTSAQYDDGAR